MGDSISGALLAMGQVGAGISYSAPDGQKGAWVGGELSGVGPIAVGAIMGNGVIPIFTAAPEVYGRVEANGERIRGQLGLGAQLGAVILPVPVQLTTGIGLGGKIDGPLSDGLVRWNAGAEAPVGVANVGKLMGLFSLSASYVGSKDFGSGPVEHGLSIGLKVGFVDWKNFTLIPR
ncbi:MAG: hypothetical protein IT381_01390 [Deltaproteobacteria bacterium]|nr:hypothetical protein [Deltaproteobacteria bacterium]